MKGREKMLASVILGLVGLWIAYVLVGKLYMGPMSELDAKIAAVESDIRKLEESNKREIQYKTRIKQFAAKTFDAEELRASELARSRLVELLGRAGLAGESMSIKPVAGTRVTGIYKEIGWSVHARGRIDQLISFLYLVAADPRLHQVDSLTLAPMTRTGEIDMNLRYMTIVLEAPKGEKPPAAGIELAPLPPANPNTPQRQNYQLIALRDLFRPYVPRPAQVASQDQHPDFGQQMQEPQESGDGRLKLVGLPSWSDQRDIIIRDSSSQQVIVFRPGDDLCGGRIVMVDYRRMALPDRPQIVSGSRVILELEREYWAVELGQTLADRYRLTSDRLPPELKSNGKSEHSGDAGGATTQPSKHG